MTAAADRIVACIDAQKISARFYEDARKHMTTPSAIGWSNLERASRSQASAQMWSERARILLGDINARRRRAA